MDKTIKILLITSLFTMPVQASEYFKYIDNIGNTSLGNFVPVKFIKNGYELIDTETGIVLETVDRQLTDLEIEAILAQEKRDNTAKQFKRKIEEEEQEIFKKYRTMNDILISEGNSLDIIDFEITKKNKLIISIKKEIEENEQQGQALEYSGVSTQVVEVTIKDLLLSIEDSKLEIEGLEMEKLVIKQAYQLDRERLQLVLDRKLVIERTR
jgi:hypothetical protein